MRERYIQTELAEYRAVDWDGTPPPLKPFADNVVVLLDQVKDRTSGGVILAETSVEVNNRAAETGVIVAMGPDAFRYNMDRSRLLADDERPKVGERVCFTRYSGTLRVRKDAKSGEYLQYRVMTDRCIGAGEMAEEREITPPMGGISATKRRALTDG